MGIFDKMIDRKVAAKLQPIIQDMQQKSYNALSVQFSRMAASYFNLSTFNPNNSDTLYTILKKKATKEASVPLYVYRKKDKGRLKAYEASTKGNLSGLSFQKSQLLKVKALEDADTTSDLAILLSRPSFTMGADAFWYGVFYEFSMGEAFIYKNRGGKENGKPVELVLYKAEDINVIPTFPNSRVVKEYHVADGAGVMIVQPKDMIHWKTYNRDCPTRGYNPLEALRKRLTQDDALTDQATFGAQNHGSDGVVFPKQLGVLTPEQETQVSDTFSNRNNKASARKSVTYSPIELDYINFSRTADEMQILEQLGWTFERMCHAFGIPPVIFNTDAAFSNQEWGLKNWITNSVMPVLYSLRDELNRSLVPEFDKGLYIDADFSSLPEMQDDMKKLLDGASPLFDRGALTPNEMRQLAGYEPTTNPLHNDYYITGTYAPLSDMTMQDQPEPLKNLGDY